VVGNNMPQYNYGQRFIPQPNRFIPPSLPVGGQIDPSRFGYNVNIPQPPTSQQPSINFADAYSRINANRPNRLAYQQAIEGGTPQIERSKWAKLGAMLTAGAAGAANPRDPGGSYNLAMSSYFAPQERANVEYEKKLRGLGQLAQFEESDKASEIQALESQQADWYRKREDERQTRASELTGIEATRRGRESEEEAAARRRAEERANWLDITDPTDGNTYLVNRNTQERRLIGKTVLTSQEKINEAKDKLAAELKIKEPFEIAADTRATNRALAVAREGTTRATGVANIKAEATRQAAAAKIREKAAQLPKADEVYKNMLLSMAVEIDQGRLPEDAAGYLKMVNGVPTADRGFFGFSEQSQQTEDAVRKFIGSYLAGNRGGGSNTLAPNVQQVDVNTLPKNPDGTVTMYDPQGVEFKAQPSEVQHYLNLKPPATLTKKR
jgi:hypothetical protein